MKLSIITITYNNLSALVRTIDSVLRQTFTDWELIVVDGGSSDGTAPWLQQLTEDNRDKAIRYVSEPDNGIYNAQNKGIGMALGEYCYFLNAGDELRESSVLEEMMHSATADIVYGNEIEVYYENGMPVQENWVRGVDNPTALDLYSSCMKHQASFMKRDLFLMYGTYDETLRVCADWEWFWRVIAMNDNITLEYRNIDIASFEAGGFSYVHPEIDSVETEIVRNRYMSKRLQQDMAFFSQYERLRDAKRYPLLHFLLRFIMWCIKKLRRQK